MNWLRGAGWLRQKRMTEITEKYISNLIISGKSLKTREQKRNLPGHGTASDDSIAVMSATEH